jgi:hypothetical protein
MATIRVPKTARRKGIRKPKLTSVKIKTVKVPKPKMIRGTGY